MENKQGTRSGDADHCREPAMMEQELLVVSVGTGSRKDCQKTIGGIEYALKTAFPGWPVRRAFTNQKMIRCMADRDGVNVDTVPQAMDRAVRDGVKVLTVQPTHMSFGLEYHDLVHELVKRYCDYEKITLGQPLLSSNEDFLSVAKILSHALEQYRREDTAICFVSRQPKDATHNICCRMQDALRYVGHDHFFAGSAGHAEEMLQALAGHPYRRVVLIPLMMVADQQAEWIFAGPQPDSWKNQFERAGYEVICLLRGLGEMEPIRQIIVRHTRDAMRLLSDDPVQ